MKRALIVDDEDHRHRFYASALGPTHEVSHARTPLEAVLLMTAHAFDLLHLDYDLSKTKPKGAKPPTGMDVVRALIGKDSTCKRPAHVIVHSVNPWGNERCVSALRAAGIKVTSAPFSC